MKRVVCWWRAIRFHQWGEIYGGHTVDEEQMGSRTGALFAREFCSTCGMFFGYRG